MTEVIQDCAEYICGCCLHEEFATPNVIEACSYGHNQNLHERFKTQSHTKEFDRIIKSALATYENVIADVNMKINDFRQELDYKIPENITKALDETEKLIDEQNVDAVEKVYKLLKLHGDLIKQAQKQQHKSCSKICFNCGAFTKSYVKDKGCDHKFCKSYSKIRALVKQLREIRPKQKDNK